MSRLVFLLFLLAAIGVAGALFQVKYEVQDLERELAEVNSQILADQEAVHVLKAEWSYLNQPARIAALASRHLEFGPMKLEQVTRIAALPPRPEDFGYAQAGLEDALPEPRARPAMPADWRPRRLTPAPEGQEPRPEQAVTRQVAAPLRVPAPVPEPVPPEPVTTIEEKIAQLVAETSPPTGGDPGLNPVTGRPLPVSAGAREVQR